MRVGFGEAGVVEATFVRTGLLAVTPPASQTLQTVPLALAVDVTEGTTQYLSPPAWAGELREMALTATYYDSRRPPDVTLLAPIAGELTAHTPLAVTGENFAPSGEELVCSIGGVLVAATFGDAHPLRCDAPPLSLTPFPTTVAVAASNDGGGSSGATRPFTYYDATSPPSLDEVRLSSCAYLRLSPACTEGAAPALVRSRPISSDLPRSRSWSRATSRSRRRAT